MRNNKFTNRIFECASDHWRDESCWLLLAPARQRNPRHGRETAMDLRGKEQEAPELGFCTKGVREMKSISFSSGPGQLPPANSEENNEEPVPLRKPHLDREQCPPCPLLACDPRHQDPEVAHDIILGAPCGASA